MPRLSRRLLFLVVCVLGGAVLMVAVANANPIAISGTTYNVAAAIVTQNGRYVYMAQYTSDPTLNQIARYDVQTGETTLILPTVRMKPGTFQITPDEQYLIYAVPNGEFGEIRRYTIATGENIVLDPIGGEDGDIVLLTADGAYVIYVRRDDYQLYSQPVAGGDRIYLSADVPAGPVFSPVLSPSGGYIAWVVAGNADRLFLAPTDGSAPARQISPTGVDVDVQADNVFVESHNIIFFPGNNGTSRDIYRADLASGEGVVFAAGAGALTPLITPDEQYLIHNYSRGGGQYSVGRTNISTGTRVPLAAGLAHSGMVVSETGNRLFYTSGNTLYSVRYDPVSPAVALEFGIGTYTVIRAAPDGSRVVYKTHVNGNGNNGYLRSAVADGSVAPVFLYTDSSVEPSFHISPDGQRVYFRTSDGTERTVRSASIDGSSLEVYLTASSGSGSYTDISPTQFLEGNRYIIQDYTNDAAVLNPLYMIDGSQPPMATLTPLPTLTPTPSATGTPTGTPPSSPTLTPSPTCCTPVATMTRTPSVTPNASLTPTPTLNATQIAATSIAATGTATNTPIPTATGTPTVFPEISPTLTPSPTCCTPVATMTRTPSVTPNASLTATPTLNATQIAATGTATPVTLTPSATATLHPTITSSATATHTATATGTATATHTATTTVLPPATHTATMTVLPSATTTATGTPTPHPLPPTATTTPTPVPTVVATPTAEPHLLYLPLILLK